MSSNTSSSPEHGEALTLIGTGHIKPPQLQETYACGEPNCMVTGPPEEMFNIACNARETSDDELVALVRCKNCAVAYARRTGRIPGQSRSGVFPLAGTLKMRAECGIITPITFYCADIGCAEKGEPRRLFNLAFTESLDSYGIEAVLKRIRCQHCAEKVARANGRALGQRGCGVYPLIHTLLRLKWYVPEDAEERRRLEHIIWDHQRRRNDL